jgi:hypothetical protein
VEAQVDEILAVTTEEAIFAGTSTGANVAAAVRVATRLGADATVATIAVDSGLTSVRTCSGSDHGLMAAGVPPQHQLVRQKEVILQNEP